MNHYDLEDGNYNNTSSHNYNTNSNSHHNQDNNGTSPQNYLEDSGLNISPTIDKNFTKVLSMMN